MQQNDLFNDYQDEHLDIAQAAAILNVSTATIRNWLKANYIKKVGRNQILRSSLLDFYLKEETSTKLSGRANKSQKDSHNHLTLGNQIKEKLSLTSTSLDKLGEEYESSLSDSYRNKEGIYYTPKHIVDDLFNLQDIGDATFCDPCCGSGNFIIRALELGFKPENIFAFDIDPIAIDIARKRFFDKTGHHSKNIICQDFLTQDFNKYRFDHIYTNPPWGKKLDKQQKNSISNKLEIKNSDSFVLFFYRCLHSLKDNGSLGFLLPDAFLNISTYEEMRKTALSLQIISLKNYGRVFKKLQTEAVGLILSKNKNNKEKIKCSHQNRSFLRTSQSFLENPKHIFNIHCNENENNVIKHILSIPHITLKNNAKWALGIVTGNNKKFVYNQHANNLTPIYKGSDITNIGLKEASHFIDIKEIYLYQQVAPMELYYADKKLMYKFISSRLCFFYDTQKRLPLNSANILITNSNIEMKTLSNLFNSNFINWFFKMLFNTHKILRSDIEQIPIHSQFLKNGFNEQHYLSSLNIEETENGTYRIKA